MVDGAEPSRRLWLCDAMGQLTGVEHPRFVREKPRGAPMGLEGYETLSLLGQERHFCDHDRIDALLNVMENELELDPHAWRRQAWFFRSLFQSFFRDTDGPAWIKICPARWSFHQRVKATRRQRLHTARPGRALFAAHHLGRERLSMNDTSVPTARLRMHHLSRSRDDGLRLRELFVERVVREDGFGPPVVGYERWTLLASNSAEERRSLKRGINLTLEEFRDASGMQTAPLVSLCRVAEGGRWVIHRCFSLRPGPAAGAGDVIDFRTCDYSKEFYFRSDLSTHTMLERLLTPGMFEHF